MSWGKKKPQKRVPGQKIKTIGALVNRVAVRGEYVFWNGKAYHPRVVMNWPIAMLVGAIRYSRVQTAKLNPLYVEPTKEIPL